MTLCFSLWIAFYAVPAFAYRVVKGNENKDGPFYINLKGIGIGNGWVNPYIQYAAYPEFAYVQAFPLKITQNRRLSIAMTLISFLHERKTTYSKQNNLINEIEYLAAKGAVAVCQNLIDVASNPVAWVSTLFFVA